MSNLVFEPSIDFQKECAAQSTYAVSIEPQYLERLSASCVAVQNVAAKFSFYTDLQGINLIEGQISAQVELVCERCGQALELQLQSIFKSTIDKTKVHSLRLEDKFEVVDLNAEGRFELLNYLEDCLLLELPYIPRHEEGQCARQGQEWSFGDIESVQQDNPFAVLKALKDK